MGFCRMIFHFILIAQVLVEVFGYSCPFDDAVLKTVNIPKVFVNYRHSRFKRDVINHYSPLRFHVELGGLDEDDAKKVGPTLKAAASTVSHMLNVIPVNGPLLLERRACGSTWTQGPNKGRCSSLRSKYRGEFCENKIDNFKIPEEHLDVLHIYNFAEAVPVHTLPAGLGADAADYILYVTSHLSSWCLQPGIKAYSSYCRLDQYGRPIAGFINFCPDTVDQLFKHVEEFMKVAFHELFHVLGFSKDLFSQFSGCAFDELYCEKPKYFIQNDRYNVPRLRFPKVIQEARNHFGCEATDFGAPLEMINGSYTSHWDPLLMYGSIMAPHFDKLGFALIDPITLSVFADSGWYRVNFSYAEPYTWGKDEGCGFGLTGECNNAPELCEMNAAGSINDSIVGCDFLHFTQTVCQKLQPNHHCGIYKPNGQNDCRTQGIMMETRRMKDLRCFVTHKDDKISTMCTAFFCKNDGKFAIFVQNEWVTCPYNTIINVNGMEVVCPKADVFCHQAEAHSDTSSADKSSSLTMMIAFTVFAAIWVTVCGMVLGVSLFHFVGNKLHLVSR